MKGKKWIVVITLILVVMLAGCSSASTELSDQFDEETVKAEAMKSIELFNSRDYQGIIDMGSDEMKESITADEFKKQSDPYLDKNGSFKEIEKEYYYYVKAVPKLAVSAPKKQVSRINEHKDTAIIDTDDIKKVAAKRAVPPAKKKQASVTNWKRKNADEILLTRSLNKDLKERQPKQ